MTNETEKASNGGNPGQDQAKQLKRLQVTRRAHRGQMTKLQKRADTLISSFSQSEDTREHIQLLEGLVSSMENKVSLLGGLDAQITDLTSEADLETSIIEADEYMEVVGAQLRMVKYALQDFRNEHQPAVSAETTLNVSQAMLPQPGRKSINLPKLALPRYDGDPLRWVTFMDAFTAAVDSDSALQDIQKLQYLISQLDGEAARTLEGLQLSNANYQEAMSMLLSKYGQPHKIITAYMKALWDLPSPADEANAIRAFYDNMETYIRGLKSLGKTEDTYGDLLVPVIFEKLPPHIKTQITRDHGDRAWSLSELKTAIYKEMQALEAGNLSASTSDIASSAAMFHVGSKPGPPRTSADSSYHKKPAPSCAFCKGNHYSTDCIKVSDKSKRYDIAKRDRLCFNCLKANHPVSLCKARGRCRNCSKKHHTSICVTDITSTSESSTGGHSDSVKKAGHSSTHVNLAPSNNGCAGPVLLKTASAKLWKDQHAVHVNVLLDEGAQRSFVTEKIARLLQIDRSQCITEQISLATFGDTSPYKKHIPVTDFDLQLRKTGKLHMSTLIVPRISAPVKNYRNAAVASHDYLQNLLVADHADEDLFEIDLLIGADYYWSIVEDTTVRGPGPTAVDSKLGFLLSGPTFFGAVTRIRTWVVSEY